MIKNEVPYWIAIANLPRWGSEKINRLIVKIIVEKRIGIYDFFELPESNWRSDYNLADKEISDLQTEKKSLPNYSFLAENLINQGFDVIPVVSPDYSTTLKANLKTKSSPPVIYIKGNKQILKEKSVAIVGSRDASELSLRFTDNIARKASEDFKVIVSGFAKGVDRQALESALKYKGQSIIVLPQGILTFSTGIKKYYEQIVEGNLLVLSTFHPQVPWSTGLAMARNSIIYGLASEIYVAQSGDSGGTWEGVMGGLKSGRTIFVRYPHPSEQNANKLLIEKGAVPVDFDGNILITKEPATAPDKTEEKTISIEEEIINLFMPESVLTLKDIKEKLNSALSIKKISLILKSMDKLEKVSSNPVKYRLKSGGDLIFDF